LVGLLCKEVGEYYVRRFHLSELWDFTGSCGVSMDSLSSQKLSFRQLVAREL